MHLQQVVLAVAFAGAILFGVRAAYSREKRLTLVIVASILIGLAGYEYVMDRWEKTVTAPIRLDMLVEIPLIAICLIWGLISLIPRTEKLQPAERPTTKVPESS